MKSSLIEKRDLLAAGIMISLAFAILLSGGIEGILHPTTSLVFVFVIAFVTAGLGFLVHELMHKFVAQRYGYFAEFRAYYLGLWIAIGFSLAGFILAAPGAVFIRGNVNREKNGKISLAGPLTNVVLSIVFLIVALIGLNLTQHTAYIVGALGFSINSLLALFNMIPVMPFDGAKIHAWNRKVYYSVLATAAVLFVLSFVL